MSAAITSRRALLTAGAATIAAVGSLPASAESGGDAELTRFVAVYREADARLDAADEAQGDAVERLWDLGGLYLPTPEAMFAREGDKAFGIFHSLSIDHDDADQVRFHVSPDNVNYLRKVPRKREGLRWERIEDRDQDTFFLHRRTRDGVEEFGVTINVPWPDTRRRGGLIMAGAPAPDLRVPAAIAAHRRAFLDKRMIVSAHSSALGSDPLFGQIEERSGPAYKDEETAWKALLVSTPKDVRELAEYARYLWHVTLDEEHDSSLEVGPLKETLDALQYAVVAVAGREATK